MALDVGDAKIGVALSRSGLIADPLTTLERAGRRPDLNAIEELVTANRVTVCVVGLPLLESGEEGEQAEKTRAFGRSLQRRFPKLRIVFEDERHSSGNARELLGRRARERGSVDRIAAALILQQYLDRLHDEKKNQPNEGNQGT
jgi:putative Holliday junction resolvase